MTPEPAAAEPVVPEPAVPEPAAESAPARGETNPATSFGRAHGAYELGRPEYPAAALAWLLPASPGHVVDVGAGTGKLSRGVLAAGHRVTAVDPDPEMLAALARRSPEVITRVGTGEATGLASACADGIVFGQSWHWVDPAAGSREAARVLRPGGRLGLIWNTRDDRSDLVRELTRIMGESHAEQLLCSGGPRIEAPFAPPETARWEWTRQMTVPEIIAMAESRSLLITMPEPERARTLGEIRTLLAEHPDSAGRERIPMPYVTRGFRAEAPHADRPGGAARR